MRWCGTNQDEDCDGVTDEGFNVGVACSVVGSSFSPSLSHYVVGTDAPCDEHILSKTIDGVEISAQPADHNQANQGCSAIHGIKDDD